MRKTVRVTVGRKPFGSMRRHLPLAAVWTQTRTASKTARMTVGQEAFGSMHRHLLAAAASKTDMRRNGPPKDRDTLDWITCSFGCGGVFRGV